MIAAEEPRRLLNHVALLNDELGYLRVQLEELHAALGASSAGAAGRSVAQMQNRLIIWWQLFDARARALTNALWSAAGSDEFSYWLPEQIRAAGVNAAFEDLSVKGEWPGQYRPAIGTWIPDGS